jgi:transposase-like protein
VAFTRDERTVAAWARDAGQHCAAVHAHLVEAGQVATRHVQVDELWVKLVGGKVCPAMAMATESRLWMGWRAT